jgi:hypothetical protein
MSVTVRGPICREKATKMDEAHYEIRPCKGANPHYINKMVQVRGHLNNYESENGGRK